MRGLLLEWKLYSNQRVFRSYLCDNFSSFFLRQMMWPFIRAASVRKFHSNTVRFHGLWKTSNNYQQNSNYWGRQLRANGEDPDQAAPKEQPDQGLLCLPFHLHLLGTLHYSNSILYPKYSIFRTNCSTFSAVPLFIIFIFLSKAHSNRRSQNDHWVFFTRVRQYSSQEQEAKNFRKIPFDLFTYSRL